METGDEITISIPQRSMTLNVDDETLAARRSASDASGWKPVARDRKVSTALQVFGSMAQSADKGAARRFDG